MNFRGILFGIAAATVLMTIGTSAVRPADRTSGLEAGDVLPEMKVTAERAYDLVPAENSNRYTLVHFWAAYDAESRAENVVWDRFFASTVSDKIAYRGICLDPDEEVFTQTLTLDGVDALDQYSTPTDKRLDLMRSYGLEQKFHSYLVDDRGVILSVDPTPEELERFYLL